MTPRPIRAADLDAISADLDHQVVDVAYMEMHQDQYARLSGREVPEGTAVVRLRRVHQPALWIQGKRQPAFRWVAEFVREDLDSSPGNVV